MTTENPVAVRSATELRTRRLPGWVPYAVAAGALVLGWLLISVPGAGGPVLTGVVAALLFMAGLFVTSAVVEGSRSARNRLATTLIYAAFLLALAPLASV